MYHGKQAKTGNSLGLRFERALFHSHPEFSGEVEAHIIGPGRMLVVADPEPKRKSTEEDPRGEPDLSPAHERWLSAWAMREFDSQFLFVTGYPMVKRPFYTHPDPERPEYSNSFDLLFRGQELVTGGQRLHRYSDYLSALNSRNDSPDNYSSYLSTFAHGMPPHGGFAIGLERWISRLIEADNIRYATLFPRDVQRLEP